MVMDTTLVCFSCVICQEPWKSSGRHQVCCLPCGHIYGLSCINKWIRRNRSCAKCPQCKEECTLDDVMKLFGLPTIVLFEDLQKKNKLLEDENISMLTQIKDLFDTKDILDNEKRRLQKKVRNLKQIVQRMSNESV